MNMNKTAVANQTDQLLEEIAAYAVDGEITSKEAIETARYVLIDTLGCGMLALNFPECTKHLGTSYLVPLCLTEQEFQALRLC